MKAISRAKVRAVVFLMLMLGASAMAAGLGGNIAAAQDHPEPAFSRAPHVDRDGLVVLGLGAGPVMWPDRNNTGFLLVVNGAQYMIDCGAGTPNAIFKLGLGYGPLDNLFFTHYHFDHYVGYADLLARGYQTRTPRRLDSLDVWGPPGLQGITDGLLGGLAVGAALHNWNPSRPNLPTVPNVHEFDLPETGIEPVYEDENVLVSATRVDHDVDVPNAYAYRFDIISGPSAGKSVVFSGDTRKNDQLIALAMDATILVHEVQKSEWAARISPPRDAAVRTFDPLPYRRFRDSGDCQGGERRHGGALPLWQHRCRLHPCPGGRHPPEGRDEGQC